MKQILHKSIIFLVLLASLVAMGWKCPVQNLTGIPCPGCMMTTALFAFLRFDFIGAFYFNPAFYVLLIGAILALMMRNQPEVLKRLAVVVIVIWLLIYIIRLFTLFPNWPMPYFEDNMIHQLYEFIRVSFK